MRPSQDPHTETYEPGSEATQCNEETFPLDSLLRNVGFQIHSRPKTGPVIWIKGKRTYAQADAVALAMRLVQEAKAREKIEGQSKYIPN